MHRPRALVPIPRQLAEQIDKIAGQKQRAKFVVELLERELRRREQFEALREAAGCWKDADHPELAGGSEEWIREMRQASLKRLENLEHLKDE